MPVPVGRTEGGYPTGPLGGTSYASSAYNRDGPPFQGTVPLFSLPQTESENLTRTGLRRQSVYLQCLPSREMSILPHRAPKCILFNEGRLSSPFKALAPQEFPTRLARPLVPVRGGPVTGRASDPCATPRPRQGEQVRSQTLPWGSPSGCDGPRREPRRRRGKWGS